MQEKQYVSSLVSIVIPVYNAASFLKRTLQSVKKQTYENWELIVVDDASTDDSRKVLSDWVEEQNSEKVRIILKGQNSGAAATRNAGVREARGRYLAFLDADDYWEADKLEKQLRFMKQKGCAFSFTGYEFADRNGVRNGKVVRVPAQISYSEALKNTTISTITVLFDREKIPEELLLMPENCTREDTATWWKILKHGYTAYGLNEALSVYCRHKGSASANKWRAVRGTWDMYRKQEKFPVVRTACYLAVNLFHAVRRRI